MCVRPIFVPGSSPSSPLPEHCRSVKNIVPCNKCYECQQMIVDGYVTRCVFEYLHTIKNGGCCFYYTLTYNDAYIPRYNGLKCFNVKDCQKFIKNLRYHFKKLGIKFTYFLTSEFGHNTYRPHYHILFFFNRSVVPVFLRTLISRFWFYGFNAPGDNYGLVDSVSAVKYCCKYVAKDNKVFDYLEKSGVTRKDIESIVNSNLKRKVGVSLLPFHLQSVGLGSCICDILQDDDLINGKLTINDTMGLASSYLIPLYIIRKKCYDTVLNNNGNVTYKLNAYGLKIKKSQILKSIEPLAKEYEVLFSLLPYYYERSPYLKKCSKSLDDLTEQIYRCNHGCCDFIDLACYKLFYHHYYDKYDLWFNPGSFKDSLESFYRDYNNVYSFYTLKESKQLFSLFFGGYDFLIKIFNALKSLIKYDKYQENVRAYNLAQKYRSFTTGKYRPIDLLSYETYSNLKYYNLCTNITRVKLPSWSKPNMRDILFSPPLMERLF